MIPNGTKSKSHDKPFKSPLFGNCELRRWQPRGGGIFVMGISIILLYLYAELLTKKRFGFGSRGDHVHCERLVELSDLHR